MREGPLNAPIKERGVDRNILAREQADGNCGARRVKSASKAGPGGVDNDNLIAGNRAALDLRDGLGKDPRVAHPHGAYVARF